MDHFNLPTSTENEPISSDTTTLQIITSILTSSFNVKDTVSEVFSTLKKQLKVSSATLSLIDPYTQQFYSEMEYGLTETQKQSAEYRSRLKVAKKCCEEKKPLCVQKISEAPKEIEFLKYFSHSTSEHAFLAVPIIVNFEVIGSMTFVLPFESTDLILKRISLFEIICLLIGQEIKLIRLRTREQQALIDENIKLKGKLHTKYNIQNMIGNSKIMQDVYENIRQVAHTNSSVLIRGESGTGKELVAHAIHYNSDRKDGPFIRINCGAIPETLIESELFGYEKGAFTDAHDQKIGKFEAANHGTIFLDEIAELPLLVQVKLLRILQEKEFNRIGGNDAIQVDIRIIAATNKNLEDEVTEKRFRQDLYYRLNVFPIYLPPLRDRSSDIMLLADHFLDKYNLKNKKDISRISSKASDALLNYKWPGNVRELENIIERSVILCNGKAILIDHLPELLQKNNHASLTSNLDNLSLNEQVSFFEKNLISHTLKQCDGNQSKVARKLGSTPRIIGYKIQTLDIKLDDL